MSYTLKVGKEGPGDPVNYYPCPDEDMVVGAMLSPDEDEVDVPGPGDCVMVQPNTIAMDIETVLSHAAELATDDDDEVWLEFIE